LRPFACAVVNTDDTSLLRLLSVRADDVKALMVDANVVDRREPKSVTKRLFNDPQITHELR
jgi:hypothetical protein